MAFKTPLELVVFDVDGTLTPVRSIWEYLHQRLGIWESEGLPNLHAYLNGQIDYQEFARRDASGYSGCNRSYLMELIHEIPLRSGAQECLDFFFMHGVHIALISTGLDLMVNRIPRAHTRISNMLQFENDVCTGRVTVQIPIDGKRDAFIGLLASMNISNTHTLVIGDSSGDIEMMRAAGFSIAVQPSNSAVSDAAGHVIDGDTLAGIPDLVLTHFDMKRDGHR